MSSMLLCVLLCISTYFRFALLKPAAGRKKSDHAPATCFLYVDLIKIHFVELVTTAHVTAKYPKAMAEDFIRT